MEASEKGGSDAASRSGTEATPRKRIKRERSAEDMHEFAETAMNELLGWYGYAGAVAAARDDSSKTSTRSFHSRRGSNDVNSSDSESPPKCSVPSDGCEWCGKLVQEGKALSSSGSTFCSEPCFSHSRRANFKKNKTCDWCRHVRHTVSYVDFQEGACQLQFCSDKCLNQYKMHIFCRETRAHLEMHPHLPEDPATRGGSLITPDLWLRNCKSPSDRRGSLSRSPPSNPSTPPPSFLASSETSHPLVRQTASPSLPLIRLAHPSTYMSPSAANDSVPNKRQQKTTAKRKQRIGKKSPSVANKAISSTPFFDSPASPQDLRVRASSTCASPALFSQHYPNSSFSANSSSIFPYHASFFEQHFAPSSQKPPPFPPLPLPPPPPPQPPPPLQNAPEKSFSHLLPPVTVLVPYPVIIPLPLPIPIPIPFTGDAKICCKKSHSDAKDASSDTRDEQFLCDDGGKEQTETSKGGASGNTTNLEDTRRNLRKRKRAASENGKIVSAVAKSKKLVIPT